MHRQGTRGLHPLHRFAMRAGGHGHGPAGGSTASGRRASAACAAATSAPRCSSCSPSSPTPATRLMEELERRSGGAWRPSPGSVYPTLQAARGRGPDRPGARRRPHAVHAHRGRQGLRRGEPRGARLPVGEVRRGHRRGAGSSCAAWSPRSAPRRSRSAPRATTPRSPGRRSCWRRRAAGSTRSSPTRTSPATARGARCRAAAGRRRSAPRAARSGGGSQSGRRCDPPRRSAVGTVRGEHRATISGIPDCSATVLAGMYIDTSSGARIWAHQQGEGDPILFIGGLGDPIEVWQSQIDAFAGEHRVIAHDNRGAGRSRSRARA